MTILINNPVLSTWIFAIIFIIVLVATIRWKKTSGIFTLSDTLELKGLAILAVIFCHLGYFLSTDHRFMWPFSMLGGVGVNLFLFLSGMGLTISSLKNKLSLGQFYKKRLFKIFPPFWLVLIIFILLDYFVLDINYSWHFIWQSIIGYFPQANLFADLDSPLWYFTLILFYYLIFPLVFSKKQPWLSAIIIYFISYNIIKTNPAWIKNVYTLYQVHIMAFPLGIFFAWLFDKQYYFTSLIPQKVINQLNNIQKPLWLKNVLQRLKQPNVLESFKIKVKPVIYYLTLIGAIYAVGYFAYYSGVGQNPNKEQLISLLTMFLILLVFSLKRIEFKLLSWFGLYSYEIYLMHWPLVYRYDIFYKFFPGWLATILYLAVCLGLSFILNKLINLPKILKNYFRS